MERPGHSQWWCAIIVYAGCYRCIGIDFAIDYWFPLPTTLLAGGVDLWECKILNQGEILWKRDYVCRIFSLVCVTILSIGPQLSGKMIFGGCVNLASALCAWQSSRGRSLNRAKVHSVLTSLTGLWNWPTSLAWA